MRVRERDGERRILWLLVAVAALPIVVSCLWAVTHHYTPTGDRSLIGLNAHRVLSTHPPSVGMPSTMPVELDDGSEVFANHLGPGEFVALTVPSRLLGGSPAGLVLGVALVNVWSVALAVVIVDRLASRVATGWFAACCAALGFGLGAPLLWDDWNPHVALYPMVLLVVASAATVAGRRRCLPVAAVAASFVAQAHLSMVLLGLLLGAWALGGGVAADWVRHGSGVARRWRWSFLATVGAIAVSWIGPAANQLLGPQGNVALIIRSFGQESDRNGAGYALDMLTRAFTVPPLWLQRLGSVFDYHRIGPVDRAIALVVLVVLVASTVAAVRQARRDPGRAALLGTSWVALVAAGMTLVISPAPPVGISFVRWLWPVSMVVWFSLGIGVAALVPQLPAGVGQGRSGSGLWSDPSLARSSVLASAVVAVALAAATLAAPTTPRPDALDDWRSVATVSGQVHDAVGSDLTHIDFEGPDGLFAGGPELWRRLVVGGGSVRVPASYTGGTSGVWAIQPTDEPDRWVRLVGTQDGMLAPAVAPIAVLGIGLDDRARADAWVAQAQEVLAGLDEGEQVVLEPDALAQVRAADGDRAGEADRVLADARLAMFDRRVLRAIADGQATRSPIDPADAAALLDGLDEAVYVAVEIPPRS